MAEIKKSIKLIATLDDTAFKRQVEELKKGLGKDLAIDAQNLGEIKDVFKNIAKDFSEQLKKAIGDAQIKGSRVSGTRRSSAPDLEAGQVYSKRYGQVFQSKGDLDSFESARKTEAANKKALDAEQKDKTKFQEQQDRERFRQIKAQEKEKERELGKRAKEEMKQIKIQENERAAIREKRAKGFADQNERFAMVRGRLQKHLAGRAAANEGSDYGEVPSDFAQAMSKFGGGEGGLLGKVKSSIGGPAGFAAAGAVLGAAINKVASEVTAFRRLSAQREQGYGLEVAAGQGLQGAIGQSGRGLNLTSGLHATGGAVGYGLAGAAAGSFLGPVGTIVGGIAGAAYGGYKGFMSGGEEESETRKKQTQLANDALQQAKAIRDARIQAMTGGGVSGEQLTALQQRGANRFGFSPQETIQQFNQAKGFLGNAATAQNLTTMQEMQRRFGVTPGEQAQSAEIFAGAGRTSMTGGMQQTVQVLTKAMSAGMDASKASQFLKTTADYIQSSTGFGQVDTQAIQDRMAQAAFGFAGGAGGNVTQTQLDQAKNLMELTRQESTSTSGIAGIANIGGIQDLFSKNNQKLDTGTMMALMNLSSNAKPEDIQKILRSGGVSEDVMKSMTQGVQGIKAEGAEGASYLFGGDKNLMRAVLGGERGINTEQELGIESAKALGGKMGAGTLPTTQATAEMNNRIAESIDQQTLFAKGMSQLNKETETLIAGFKTFNEQLVKSIEYANKYSNQTIKGFKQ